MTLALESEIKPLFVFVFILTAISTCTTGLKELYDTSDYTSTVQISN